MPRDTSAERKRDQRNANPHAEAIAAMFLYGAEYAAQGGGSMDFWDKLDIRRRRVCADLVTKIMSAPKAGWR